MKQIGFLFMCFITCFYSQAQTFSVSITNPLHTTELDGRLLLLLSKNDSKEPRFQISDAANTQMVFGVDVDNWQPKTTQLVSVNAFGYPIEKIKYVPAGDYYVQVLLHKYETFNLQTGNTVKLPMDRGEGQHWNTAPGNIYSKPVKIHFDPASANEIQLELSQVIAPIKQPENSKYIKHIKIESKLLSKFWGRPITIGAHILLPEGYEEHPKVKYPLAIFHGHFPDDISGFRTTPPDENMKPDTSDRFHITGYNKIVEQEAYDFYKLWTGKNFPRVLVVEIQHPTPYYDDSYAVNSESQGPWGDAITYELIPEIEKQFRGIGKGWARLCMVVQPVDGRP